MFKVKWRKADYGFTHFFSQEYFNFKRALLKSMPEIHKKMYSNYVDCKYFIMFDHLLEIGTYLARMYNSC